MPGGGCFATTITWRLISYTFMLVQRGYQCTTYSPPILSLLTTLFVFQSTAVNPRRRAHLGFSISDTSRNYFNSIMNQEQQKHLNTFLNPENSWSKRSKNAMICIWLYVYIYKYIHIYISLFSCMFTKALWDLLNLPFWQHCSSWDRSWWAAYVLRIRSNFMMTPNMLPGLGGLWAQKDFVPCSHLLNARDREHLSFPACSQRRSGIC